jgi:hypothetical protein
VHEIHRSFGFPTDQVRSLLLSPLPQAVGFGYSGGIASCASKKNVMVSVCVEGRSPAALGVSGELEIEALARHADRDPADAGPGVRPCAERPEGVVVGRAREPGESECRSQESAALVEHGLLDDLVRLENDRPRNRQAECLRRLEVNHQVELRWLLYGKVSGFGAFEDFVDIGC